MIITSRNTEQTVEEMKMEMAQEVAIELDKLVDHLDAFLEIRIGAEFDELRDSIKQTIAINDALMQENMRFRDEITHLSLKSLDHAIHGYRVNVNGVDQEVLNAMRPKIEAAIAAVIAKELGVE